MIAAVVLAGMVAGLAIAADDWTALLWAISLGILLLAVTGRLADGSARSSLLLLVALALTTHMTVALTIHDFAPRPGGFVTGDDATYYLLASRAADYVRGAGLDPSQGPPLWGGQAYLFGTFVYLETGLFVLFGPNVRIPLLLNAAIAAATALLIYASASQLFGRRPALVAAAIVAFYPSMILWSSLNLKDPLATALMTLAVSAVVAFRTRPGLPLLAVPFVAAAMLVSLRSYAALTIVFVALPSLALVPSSRPRRIASVAAVVGLMLCAAALSIGKIDQTLSSLERDRAEAAVGARTAFVPTPTPAPRPSAQSTAAPSAGAAGAERPVLLRTLAYLPIGLGYAIFAPVPLVTGGLRELITAPEMLAWYVLVAAALVTVWRERRRWTLLAPAILTIAVLMLGLAIAEGNVGTLFRHRSMVVPFVVLLASPTLVSVWTRLRHPKPGDGVNRRSMAARPE